MEDEVEDGELVGSMYGVLDAKDDKHHEDLSSKPSNLEEAVNKILEGMWMALRMEKASDSVAHTAASEAADALQKSGPTPSGLKESMTDPAAT